MLRSWNMRMLASTVLIIDDELETLELLKLALERNGFRALTASNWDEVAYIVERTYKLNRPIDVILLDLMMPDRSGFDIYRALEVILTPMPPVIMLSAVTGIEQQIQAKDLGITKYITKPTTPSKLVVAINGLIAKKK